MITFDGDRSKKRKWFANKQLAVIKDIDVPAKAVQWDGFTFRVWQQGDLNGGRITAPMGAVVTCSTRGGIKLAVADFWAGGFNAAQDLYVLYKFLGVSGEFTTFFNGSIDPEETGEYTTMKVLPVEGNSPFGLINGDTEGTETVYVDDYSCSPLLIPNKGELFDIIVADSMSYYVDGELYWFRQVFEKNTSFYIANGKQTSRLSCVARHIEYADTYNPWRIYQKTGEDRYTSTHSAWKYDFVVIGEGNVKAVGYNIDVSTATLDTISFAEILNTDMPEGLRVILSDSENDGSCEPVGSYATDNVFFHAVNASAHMLSSGPFSCEVSDYYIINPTEEKWRLFYSMTVDGIVHLVNSDQFLNLLDTLSIDGVIGSWYDEKRMFEQLAGAYPNLNFTVPYDSRMFHAHDGNIYTWTREYGAVKFAIDGLTVAAVNVPTEVESETGVRPDITYAGTFDTIPLYLCICNKVKEEIKAVYYGSPFATWTKLPGVAEGLTLVHARPVSVTPTDILLIGVIKETVDVEGVSTNYYCFASLHWYFDGDGVTSTTLWQKMGRLPFVVGTNDNLQVGLYGDDSRATALANYLSPPPILPQMPVGPYDKYAIGMP